jgi:hypothetical protein
MKEFNEEHLKEQKTRMKLLMKLAGIDIIMPEPKREEVIKELGLEESIEFHRAMGEIALTSPEIQFKIIKALIISFLSNSAIIDMVDECRNLSLAISEYCKDHNEYIQKPSPEDIQTFFE